jgi:hypothetical protein
MVSFRTALTFRLRLFLLAPHDRSITERKMIYRHPRPPIRCDGITPLWTPIYQKRLGGFIYGDAVCLSATKLWSLAQMETLCPTSTRKAVWRLFVRPAVQRLGFSSRRPFSNREGVTRGLPVARIGLPVPKPLATSVAFEGPEPGQTCSFPWSALPGPGPKPRIVAISSSDIGSVYASA